jgi:murein DD-endopeptidase MepM/ murein hydrolase activator NlpD
MRLGVAGILLVLAACARSALAEQQAPPSEIVQSELAPAAAQASKQTNTIACMNSATQGGAILCRTDPGSTLALDGKPIAIADKDGVAVIGLTRTQASPAVISFFDPLDVPVSFDRRTFRTEVHIDPRTDTVSKFEMECARIAPQSPEDKHKAEVSWVKKDNALKVFSEPLAPVALIKPSDGPYSSPFGATRTYVPKTKDCEGSTSVHNGQDIAIGTGTKIHAPMAGTVILADPDLFYEGGCVFLDLGRGLVSVTMHMSRVDVKAGDRVEQGQLLGLSGATGRVTGPHLHWAIKYRNVLSDDRGTDIWLDPVLLLGTNLPGAPVAELADVVPIRAETSIAR